MSFKIEIEIEPGATKTVEKTVTTPARLYFKIHSAYSLPRDEFSVHVDGFNLTWSPQRSLWLSKWCEEGRTLYICTDGYIDEIGNLLDVVHSNTIRKAFTQLAQKFEPYYDRLETEDFADSPQDTVDLLLAPVWGATCHAYFAIVPASQKSVTETLAEPDDIYFNIVGIDPRSFDSVSSVSVPVTSYSDFDLVLELDPFEEPRYYQRSQVFCINSFGWLSDMLTSYDTLEHINVFRKHFSDAEIENAFKAFAVAIIEQYTQQQAIDATRQRKPPPSKPKTWIASASTTLELVKKSK